MMKKTLLLSILGIMACVLTPKANAYTAQELVNKGKVGRIIYMDPQYGSAPYFLEGDLTASIDSRGYLVLSQDIDASAVGNPNISQLSISISGTTATVTSSPYIQPIKYQSYSSNAIIQSFHFLGSENGFAYGIIPRTSSQPTRTSTDGGTPGQLTGTVSYDPESDSYTIDFGSYDVCKLQYNGNSSRAAVNLYVDSRNNGTAGSFYETIRTSFYVLIANSKHAGMKFVFYSPNATAKDTKYANYNGTNKSNPSTREYGVNVKFGNDNSGNNTINIYNLANLVRPFDINGSGSNHYATIGDYSGIYDDNNLQFNIMPVNYSSSIVNGDFIYNYLGIDAGQGYIDEIFGEISGSVEHGDLKSNWVDGNNGTTWIRNPKLILEDYETFYYDEYYNTKYLNLFADTEISLNSDLEYTHDLTIKKNAYGYGRIDDYPGAPENTDTYLYLNVNLENYKNSKYVEGYELYIVPGTFSKPDYSSSAFLNENGHLNGTRIDLTEYAHKFIPGEEYNPKQINTMADNVENPFEGYQYNLLIPEKDLKAQNSNGIYSLYVKTLYTRASGLEPTFHALSALGDITTGVEDIIDNGANDSDAPAQYYNLNGVLMNGDALAPGIYIRRQGSTTSKVVIK